MFINLNTHFGSINNSFGSKKKKKDTKQLNKQINLNQIKNLPYYYPISLNCVKPKTEVDRINDDLEKTYGIKSNIKNPELLKSLHFVIKDFCSRFGNNKLFNDGVSYLNLIEEPFDNDNLISLDKKGINYNLRFNSNIKNWMKINKEEAQKKYDFGLINTNNPNYPFYSFLSSVYLNMYYRPDESAYNLTQDERRTLSSLTFLTHPFAIMETYMTNKMCNVQMPPIIDNIIGEKFGIKFPDNNEYPIIVIDLSYKSRPKELNEITKILKNEYGINVDFKENTTYAKAILQSVEGLTKAAGNKKLFNGLNIEIDKKYFINKDVSGSCIEYENSGKFFIALNPDFNIEDLTKRKFQSYYMGNISTSNVVHSCISHELAHWLQWNRNDSYSYQTIDQGIRFINQYKNGVVDTFDNYKSTPHDQRTNLSRTTLLAASKVSTYATVDAGEFCSEYVAGRMDGKEYPKATNILFDTLWRGPKLNFNNINHF